MQSQEALRKAEELFMALTDKFVKELAQQKDKNPSSLGQLENPGSYGYQKVQQSLKNQDRGRKNSTLQSRIDQHDSLKDKSQERNNQEYLNRLQSQISTFSQIPPQNQLVEQLSNIKLKAQNNLSIESLQSIQKLFLTETKDQSQSYLRFGDIICLGFYHQYIEVNPNPIQNNDNLKNFLNQNQVNEILKKYKGVLWSDSVTNKNLNVISKNCDFIKGDSSNVNDSHNKPFNTINGSSQFIKCLFRIETAQECQYNMIHQKLESELLELEELLPSIDSQEYGKLQEAINEITKQIKHNQTFLDEETRNNEYELSMSLGRKITYGEKVQLKHIFSGEYLSLNQKQIAHEHGCVAIQLTDPNNSSWFAFRPSQKIREQGQAVSYQDHFYIQNFDQDQQIDKHQFFLHVSTRLFEQDDVEEIEVNGSNEPSKFKAKLFVDYKSLQEDQEIIQSGDTVKLLHKELDGYLTAIEKDVNSYLKPFPDYLQWEINSLIKPDNQSIKVNDKKENDKQETQQSQIYIERNSNQLKTTNSYWEIQKIKPFKGGSVFWDDCYRIKHIGTGKFLATSLEKAQLYMKDQPDLTDTVFLLRRDTYTTKYKDQIEPIRTQDLVILESYYTRFLQIDQYEEENFDDQVIVDESENNLEQVGYNTMGTFKQSAPVTPKASPLNVADQNQLQVTVQHEYSTKVNVLLGEFKKHEISKMVFKIEKVAQEESYISYQGSSFFDYLVKFYNYINDWAVSVNQKSPFQVLPFGQQFDLKYNKEEANKKEDELASFCEDSLHSLNLLYQLLVKAKEKSKTFYNQAQNYLAEQGVLLIIINLIELIYYKTVHPDEREKPFGNKNRKKQKTKSANKEEIYEETVYQIAAEHLHTVQELLLKLIYQLIKHNVNNADVVTRYDNVFFSQLKKHDTRLISRIFKETYKRAQEILSLDTQQNKIIQNVENMKTYQEQLMFMKYESMLAQHKSQQKQYEGKLYKWASMLDSVSLSNEEDETIDHQILFMKVISMMCCDPEGRGIYKYQMEAIKHIFGKIEVKQPKHEDQNQNQNQAIFTDNIPLKFEWKRNKQNVRVMFYIKNGNQANFDSKNPLLKKLAKQVISVQDSNIYAAFDLDDLCKNPEQHSPYIDYIIAVIEMYTKLCLSRNVYGIQRIIQAGFNYDTIIKCIEMNSVNDKIKASLIDLVKVLYVDSDSFLVNYKSQSRQYTWNHFGISYLNQQEEQKKQDGINKQDDELSAFNEQFQHRQVYLKEVEYYKTLQAKQKNSDFDYTQLKDLQPGQANTLAKLTLDYFFFLNNKDYKFISNGSQIQSKEKLQIDTMMKLVSSYLDLATSLIETQHIDYEFVNKMIQVAAMVFIRYDMEDFSDPSLLQKMEQNVVKMQEQKNVRQQNGNSHDQSYKEAEADYQSSEADKKTDLYQQYIKSYQLTKLIEFAEKQKDYRNKLDQIEIKTLKMLQHIIKLRLDTQVMMFLRIFKDFIINKKSIKIKNDDKKNNQDTEDVALIKTIFNIFQLSSMDQSQQSKENTIYSQEKIIQNINKVFKRLNQNKSDGQIFEIDMDSNYYINQKKTENLNKYKMSNFILRKLLLFAIFKQTKNNHIKDEAAKVLVMNFRQKQMLFEEIAKIDVYMSPVDQQEYLNFKFKCLQINYHIRQLVALNNFERIQNYNLDDKTNYDSKVIEHIKEIKKILTYFIFEIQNQNERQSRKQSFLRHLEIHTDLINKFMKKIDYQNEKCKSLYVTCFQYVSYFFLAFSFNNSKNQKSLLPHLNFLLDQIDSDIPNQNLIASILQKNRNTEEGQIFMNFALRKLERPNSFKSYILKLLNLMTFESPDNQVIILKILVQKDQFRYHLRQQQKTKQFFDVINSYEKSQNAYNVKKQLKEKKEIKLPFIAFGQNQDKLNEDWENLQLHLICTEILANCAKNSMYCTLQARKLVSIRRLLVQLNQDRLPLIVKKCYFRLLYDVYINDVKDLTSMDQNTNVLLEIIGNVIDKDLQILDNLPITSQTIITNELVQKHDDQDKNVFLGFQPNQSPKQEPKKKSLKQDEQSIFLEKKLEECSETIRFLSLFKQRQNKADGFLHFMADFFNNIKNTKIIMSAELTKIALQFKKFIEQLEKQIDVIYSDYIRDDNLQKPNLDISKRKLFSDIIKLKQVIQNISKKSIPNVKMIYINKKFKIDNKNTELKDETTDESLLEKEEDQTKLLYRHQIADRVVNRVREYLAQSNMKIWQALNQVHKRQYERRQSKYQHYNGNEDEDSEMNNTLNRYITGQYNQYESDYDHFYNRRESLYQHASKSTDPQEVPRKLLTDFIRAIGQNEFNFLEIQAAIDEFEEKANWLQKEREKQQKKEKSMKTHTSQNIPSMQNQSESVGDISYSQQESKPLKQINETSSKFIPKPFKKQNSLRRNIILLADLDQIFASESFNMNLLPSIFKRPEQDNSGIISDLLTEDSNIAYQCQQDFVNYTQIFDQVCQSGKIKDELQDLISNIKIIFDYSFENNKTDTIKKFIQNMINSFVDSDHKIYLMKILNMILEKYMEQNQDESQMTLSNRVIYKKRLQKLQNTMNEYSICDLLLRLINRDEKVEVANEAIKLLCSLLSESNNQIQEQILNLLKDNKKQYNLLEFMRERLIVSTEQLIFQVEEELRQFYFANKNNNNSNKKISREKIKIIDTTKHNEVLNILKLVQLFCDNCYQPFQNYLINQDSQEIDDNLLQTEENKQQKNQNDSNKKSSINILIEIANVLIKLTNRLGIVIFTEYHLFQTVEQLFDTLIDFMYGPCRQSQAILGNWKKFCKAVNFYFTQDLGYYQTNCTQQKGKLSIFSQCTKLLIALIETDDVDFKKEQLTEISISIDINVLKQKMVDIFTYKIGGHEKRQRIYNSNKKCTHYVQYDSKQTVNANVCIKNEFCAQGHMIHFDKKIINAGFNIFIYLQTFKECLPLEPKLQDCDFMMKNETSYRQNYKKFLPILQFEAAKDLVVLEAQRIQEQENIYKHKCERGLSLLDENQRQSQREQDALEQAKKDPNLKQAQTQIINKSNTILYPENGPGFSNISPYHSARTQNMNQIKAQDYEQEKLLQQKTMQQLINIQQNNKQSNALCCRKNKIHTNKDIDQQSKNSQLKQILSNVKITNKEDPEFLYKQFKLDTAIRFYIKNVASIEIDYNGKIVTVMFKIPPFCTYMGSSSRRQILYGNSMNRESQTDKLEDFFTKIKIIKAEMKSLQTLQRVSRIRKFMTKIWYVLSNVSFGIIILINLLFLIFYQTNPDTDEIYFVYPVAEVIVQLLGIIQAFISFLVVISYFQKFHGVFWARYTEKVYVKKRKWFTNFKGSLGYAFGQQTYKISYQNEQQMKTELTPNSKIEYVEKKNDIEQKIGDLKYLLRTFYYGLSTDMKLQFNVLYFGVSMLGIYYHFFFSVLLLEIIIKIPLLTSVVQAIIQNKWQITITLVLLFVIIYIYAFIAFILFRDTYINAGMGEDTDFNNYCNSLVMCFASTLNNGLRAGGGIGEVLKQLEQGESNYWGRWTFDITFFVIIIIIMLNLIFGIIIDAFADMRDQKNEIEKDVKEKCFICGITKFQFEAKNKSFQEHVLREHNVYAYLYFILYVKKKPGNECTGVEKYVKQLVIAEDPKFFPINNSLSLQEADNEFTYNQVQN